MCRVLVALLSLAFAWSVADAAEPQSLRSYHSIAGREDAWSGGARMIPIHTPSGDFRVWVKRIGNNPRIKLLLLHGGPGATHEYFEAFDSFLPAEGIEYYYYDQLGSAYSDQPEDMAPLLGVDRFVEEVEQVRTALGLGRENFYLLGHSWGGILAIEYALKYPQHLKGVVISNMVSSIPAYNHYANEVLMPEMDAEALAQIKKMEAEKRYDEPAYEELLMPHYERHVLRRPAAEWPEPVLRSFARINKKVYVPMQGPSELGASGLLLEWDRTEDLARIDVPALVIGAQYDTMEPEFKRMMADKLPKGEYLHLPNGSHMAMYDDQEAYFAGLVKWMRKVDTAAAKP